MEKIVTVRDVLLRVAESFHGIQAGHNGPRNVPETPVRNTSHWISLFGWAYRQTGQERFFRQVSTLAENLLNSEARPMGYAFKMLARDTANAGNGLIGQAWVIEGLLSAYHVLNDRRYLETAQELFHQHLFDESLCLWRVLNIDGTIGTIHTTLNQQIWFAAIGSLLESPEATQRVHTFLDHLEHHIHLLQGGLWGMKIRTAVAHEEPLVRQLKNWLRRLKKQYIDRDYTWRDFSYVLTSIGYHSFALYGLALLQTSIPDHPFWQSEILKQGLQWIQSETYKRKLHRNPFAMGYNPAGFEVPYILSAFEMENWEQESQWWLTEQIRRHYNSRTQRFDLNTADPAVLTARAYEAVRLPECLLSLSISSSLR